MYGYDLLVFVVLLINKSYSILYQIKTQNHVQKSDSHHAIQAYTQQKDYYSGNHLYPLAYFMSDTSRISSFGAAARDYCCPMDRAPLFGC